MLLLELYNTIMYRMNIHNMHNVAFGIFSALTYSTTFMYRVLGTHMVIVNMESAGWRLMTMNE